MIDRDKFFVVVRARLGVREQEQVDGFNSLLDVWDASNWIDLRWLAYALATAWHETGFKMQPLEEIGQGRGKPYGRPAGPYGRIYYGRGYVQLTWYAVYLGASQHLNKLGYNHVDLARYPEQALNPGTAALILYVGMQEGWFTGKKFGDYFTAEHTDGLNARRIINALDKAAVILGYFNVLLDAVGYGPKELGDEQISLDGDPADID